jgi:hypothetical protein
VICIAVIAAVSGCSPAEPEAVCDRVGTFHRLARNKLESLRVAELISAIEWECMTEALAALDQEISKRCVTTPQYLDALKGSQRASYAACLNPPRDSVVETAIVRSLSGP